MSKLNNFFAWSKSTNDGSISLGEDHVDGVKCAVYIANKQDVRHRLFMDIDGARQGRTTLESPGGITIKCGQDKNAPDATFVMQVENGKMIIAVETGDIEIRGDNITIDADGGEGDGLMVLKANDKIELQAPKVNIKGDERCEITSEANVRLASQGQIDFAANHGTCESASSTHGERSDNQIASKVTEGG